MRLLKRNGNGIYKLTKDLAPEDLPEYAILSHTWLPDNDLEVTFTDLTQRDAKAKPEGYAKLQFCGEQAFKDGLEHFWVDTCCINKESSAELQEAITSMFSWYRNATRCYAYLGNVSLDRSANGQLDGLPPISLWEAAFRNSRWFQRGWTLQELLAPKSVDFFSKEGIRLGDKASLRSIIHEITGIPLGALSGDPLSKFSVEERFSWIEQRQTSRREDKAYCLLGIFNVYMPLIYGEGDSAFGRLREEINKRHTGQTDLGHFLSLLPGIPGAAFNSLQNQHAPICLPNTRTELLEHIAAWVEGTDQKCIFWLNGIAGTGKSTVARTVARIYHDRRKLGGSFFFSKGGGDLSKANKLATTLARQLATRIPDAKRHICEAVKRQEDIKDHSLRDQWEQLIIQPLSKLRKSETPPTILLVIDALDECDNENDIRGLLKILTMAKSLVNIHLRIFITSRPETVIRNSLQKIPYMEREVFILHEISQNLVNRDLGLFFENQFATIRDELGFDNEWPGNRKIERLVQTSSELFIWAATACRFISKPRRHSAVNRRIDHLIHGLPSGEGPEKQLNKIYTAVLRDFAEQLDHDDEEERHESYVLLRKILGSIVILCSPLPMKPLSRLIDVDLNDAETYLTDLNTIFQIPSEDSRPVHLHHPTFRDFLLNRERCMDLNFWVDKKEAHRVLGDHCLALMSQMLHMDMCGLRTPGTLVKDLDANHIRSFIPPDLEYACLYWVEHYRQSGIPLSDGDPVDRFFREHFLHWLEVMNIIEKGAEQGTIIRLYHSLLNPQDNKRQIPFVKDARRLIFNFQNIIKQAPLQVYCAALIFIPPTNELRSHFRTQRHPCIKDSRIAQANIRKAKDDFNYVSDLSFTLDSQKIASGSNFEAIRFWDVATKATIRKYEGGATDKMSAIAISPDGKILAGGSDDFIVMAWSIDTGALLYSIRAHEGWVNSVAFSPNGKLLASGSMDQTIAFWNSFTGEEVKRINNQSSAVNSTTFSPDGLLVGTGSVDELVRLWDISKDTEELRLTLNGHSGPVNSVRFSPNGKQIASGSDDMEVKIWDTATGTELMTLKGHTNKVWAVSFSSDSQFIASGSEDKTVMLWDLSRGTVMSILRDHTSGVNSVVFSPNNALLASSSFDDEVRLWDTKSWTLIGKLDDFEEDTNSGTLATQRSYIPTLDEGFGSIDFKGHSSTITHVVFSPNGKWLASGSHDAAIKLWVGGREHWTQNCCSGGLNHLLFSPDSRLIASEADDKTLKVWDSETGASCHTFRGHCGTISSIVFSPNGQLLGSSSTDKTVRLWNPITGESCGKLEAHSDGVNGLAFSPDSRYVVTWSEDTTALIWDVSSTKMPFTMLQGHWDSVNSVAYSPDGKKLVSCAEDATICIWTTTGSLSSRITCDSLPASIAILSPDKQLIGTFSSDNVVKLYNSQTGTVKGSFDMKLSTRKLCFSSCGQYLETDKGILDIRFFLELSSSISLFSPIRSDTLSATQNWIRINMENVVWLPDEYQAAHVAIFGDLIVIGHFSGAISFFRLVGLD